MVKKILTLEELKKLPTKRLLAYKKKLWETSYSREDTEFLPCNCEDCKRISDKMDLQNDLINKVKSVLKDREHIERKHLCQQK